MRLKVEHEQPLPAIAEQARMHVHLGVATMSNPYLPDDCQRWDSDLDYAAAAGLLNSEKRAAPMTDETRAILANMLRWYEEIQDV